MLNVSLDEDTERYLIEILAQEKTTSSELLKRLLREHWQTLQSRKTFLERRGGHPQYLLEDSPSNLSDRDARQKYIAEYLHKRHERYEQQEP